MKKLLIILLFFTGVIAAQEPIFNTNFNKEYLVNFADDYNKITNDEEIAKLVFKLTNDNLFEINKQNGAVLTSNLYFSQKLFWTKMFYGINAQYNKLNTENNISSIDCFAGLHNIPLTGNFDFSVALNIGTGNYNINYNTLKSRYFIDETPVASNYSFQKTNFNVGLSAVLKYENSELGLSANHINKPGLPQEGDKIPVKFNAFIKTALYERKLFPSLIYSYQNSFLKHPVDEDFYFHMMNYIGGNIDYFFFRHRIRLGIGVSYKHLTNNSNNISLSASVNYGGFSVNYSPSYTIENTMFFHQFSISYFYLRYIRRYAGLL